MAVRTISPMIFFLSWPHSLVRTGTSVGSGGSLILPIIQSGDSGPPGGSYPRSLGTVVPVRPYDSASLMAATSGSLPVQILCAWTPWWSNIRSPGTVGRPRSLASWMSPVSPPGL